MGNHYYLTERLTKQTRELLKSKGYFTYATRSWDSGNGCTLEHRVLVNHENDVVTNFKALDDDFRDSKDDFFKCMEHFDADETQDFINEIETIIRLP